MNKIRSLTQKQLFLPIFCVFLVLCSNIIYDIAQGNAFYNFFSISIKNGVLYGRIIDILNRGSEVAILAIGMTLVVSCSAGTDISVGSVMSLCASFCCMLLSGYGVTSAYEYALPLVVCVIAGLLMGCLCGAFNGALVAYLNIQPMVATLILYSAARAIGLLLCNDQILYIRVDSFGMFGGYTGFLPTPIIIAALCILIVSIVLKKTAMGMYVQSVGINKKASRIAGLNSQKIIFLCYVLCGLCAGITGLLLACRMRVGDPTCGTVYSMNSITAAVVGGTSMAGGVGLLSGTVAGAFLIGMLSNIMNSLAVNQFYQYVVKGALLVLAMVIYSVSKLMEVKRHAK